MNPLASLLVAQHLEDLLREADADRRAHLVDGSRNRRVPAWRRLVARTARRASASLVAIATRQEPIEPARRSPSRPDDRRPAIAA